MHYSVLATTNQKKHSVRILQEPVSSLDDELYCLLPPENMLEQRLLSMPPIRKGLYWGEPRFGHPEGIVARHVQEVLRNIDLMACCPDTRVRLRIAAIVHDAFKWQEPRTIPRDWSRHHGRLARKFLEKIIDDILLLDLIEWHDEAWYIWRYLFIEEKPWVAHHRLEALIKRFGSQLQLYYLFFKADTCTGNKIHAPLRWFEQTIPGLKIVTLLGAEVKPPA